MWPGDSKKSSRTAFEASRKLIDMLVSCLFHPISHVLSLRNTALA